MMMLFMVICPDLGPWVRFCKSELTSSECALLSNLMEVSSAGWVEQLCSTQCNIKPKSIESFSHGACGPSQKKEIFNNIFL